ncbi:P27 family phage terminase small subunit [Sporosarcina highlanderae]|uniref:P27 family phage terminase small subunit n=1 Tax=Sporosarcina highlanderae TaxID=3035916 RepID=A0ABT8JW22_9BACL|nr:P27 family phage terminase small subunit [Sporosarcina highlanderae]MDN4609132.1 P27 family phage terminase small subunit [Sporosarcina highlanderae]
MVKKKAEIIEHKTVDLRKNVVADMKKLGTYKKEYDIVISIYCDLLTQYHKATQEFVASNYKYETETAAGGTKKSAIVATLENLRKDILAYSDRLCLNPKSLESVTVEDNKKSVLASVLSGLE